MKSRNVEINVTILLDKDADEKEVLHYKAQIEHVADILQLQLPEIIARDIEESLQRNRDGLPPLSPWRRRVRRWFG